MQRPMRRSRRRLNAPLRSLIIVLLLFVIRRETVPVRPPLFDHKAVLVPSFGVFPLDRAVGLAWRSIGQLNRDMRLIGCSADVGRLHLHTYQELDFIVAHRSPPLGDNITAGGMATSTRELRTSQRICRPANGDIPRMTASAGYGSAAAEARRDAHWAGLGFGT